MTATFADRDELFDQNAFPPENEFAFSEREQTAAESGYSSDVAQEIESDHEPYDRAVVSSWAKMVANTDPDKRLDIFLGVVVEEGAYAALVHAARGEHSCKQAIVDAQDQIAANHDKFGLSDDVLQKRKGAVWKAIEARGARVHQQQEQRKDQWQKKRPRNSCSPF